MKFTSFGRLFGTRWLSKFRGDKPRAAARRRPLELERLERRELLSGAAPRILSVSPLEGTTTNSRPPLTVTYSEDMNLAQVTNPANYLLFNTDNERVTVNSVSYNGVNDQATLLYNGGNPLPADRYTLFVRGDQIRDVDDNLPLAQPGQLVVANQGAGIVSLVNVNANGTLEAASNYSQSTLFASNPVAVTLADVNHDGIADLLVANSPPVVGTTTIPGLQPNVSIFRGLRLPGVGGQPGALNGFENTPSAVLELPSTFFGFSNGDPRALVVASLTTARYSNGDPVLDLAVVDTANSNVVVYLNNPQIGLTSATQGITFSTQGGFFGGTGPIAIVAADVNGDSRLDLVTANQVSGDISVLFNNDGGSFSTARTVGTTVTIATGLASGDLDGDGRPDLVVTGSGGAEVLLNRTARNSQIPSFINGGMLTTTASTSVAIGQLDTPGTALDVATTDNANANNGEVVVFLNAGGASFGPGTPFNTNPSPAFTSVTTGVSIGDVNGDGSNDLLVVNKNDPFFGTSASTMAVLRNNGTGSFTTPFTNPDDLYVTNGVPVGMAINITTDPVSGRKVVDEAVTANGNDPITSLGNDVTLYRAKLDGSGLFFASNDTTPLPGFSVSAVAKGDFNADGLTDIVIADPINNKIAVLLATGNPSNPFGSPRQFGTGSDPVAIAVGDLNGDGRPDIVVANQLDSTLTVLLNAGGGAFNPQPNALVGRTPTGLVMGDFNRDGTLDVAVSHTGFNLGSFVGGFFGTTTAGGFTVLTGNGNGTFRNAAEFGSSVPSLGLATADFEGDGNLDIALVDGNPNGNVYIYRGDGFGRFALRAAFPAGEQPNSIAVGDLNRDGLPDIVVTNDSLPASTTSSIIGFVSTAYVSVLLNTPGKGFSNAIRTDLVRNTNRPFQSVTITNVNNDLYPDVVAGAGVGGFFFIGTGFSFNNVVALEGNGDGSFKDPRFYATGGGGDFIPPSTVAVLSDPLLQATSFTVQATTVNTNLIQNGNFSTITLQSERGNLLGWQTYNLRNSRGGWSIQKGFSSPLSAVDEPAPSDSGFTAMLDQPDRIPLTALDSSGISADPAQFAYLDFATARSTTDYDGTHTFYQDFKIPATATNVTLTFSLLIDNSDPNNIVGYSDPNQTPTLDYFEGLANRPSNQQVRVDIVDPLQDFKVDPITQRVLPDVSLRSPSNTTGAVLQPIFGTNRTTPLFVPYTSFTVDLTRFAGQTVRFRVASVNNLGKLIVGLDNVRVRATFTDTQAPNISNLRLRNPGFGLNESIGFGGNTSDPTLIGRVSDNGIVSNQAAANIDRIDFDINNDGNYTGPGDVSISRLIPAALDTLGNFQLTLPITIPGPYTIGVRAVDKAGNATTTSITFVFQGASTTAWTAQGPGPIRFVSQGVDYQTVSGRVTSVALDPRDINGNTFYIGSVNGGVWKTTDGGVNWTPLTSFLTDPTLGNVPAAIGSVAVTPVDIDPNDPLQRPRGQFLNDPDIVYAGTGIADNALDSHAGIGVLKSTDGGKSWTVVGRTVFAGARISKVAVTHRDSQGRNRVFVAVASGGQFGPGLYMSTDEGQTWANTLNPATMFLDAGGTLGAGLPLASVTDVAIDTLSSGEEKIWVGIGNIGLVNPGAAGTTNTAGYSAGVWLSTNGGQTWLQQVGGHDQPRVLRQLLPPALNSDNGAARDGHIVGRVTIALATGRVADDGVVYVLIGNPTPMGSFTDGGTGGKSGTDNRLGLYKTKNGGLSWTHVMLRENHPIPNRIYNFIDLELAGDEAGAAAAMTVDPANSNVVYVGGSTRYLSPVDATIVSANKTGETPFNRPDKPHGFIRVDTSNMRDTTYITPFAPGCDVRIPNDGDDIIKAALAAEQTADPVCVFTEPGNYATTPGGTYEGEGVFWYDLQTEDQGDRLFGFFVDKLHLPGTIHALAFDPRGRLLVGTEGGIYRGVSQGFTYDITSGGAGVGSIIVNTTALSPYAPFSTPIEGGMTFNDLNGNLQISDQTSVAIDPYDRKILNASAASTGWSRTSGGLPGSLEWVSTNVVNPSGSGFILLPAGQVVFDGFAQEAPFAGPVRVGPRDPNAAPGTQSNVYRSHSLIIYLPSSNADNIFGQLQFSNAGGQQGTFFEINRGLNLTEAPTSAFLPLAVNSVKQLLGGSLQDELLFATNKLYESDNNGQLWDPVSVPFLQAGEFVTALTFASAGKDAWYVGTSRGRVLVELADGANGLPNRSAGLPGQAVNGIAADPRNPLVAYAMTDGTGTGGHVWKTINGGGNWTNVGTPASGLPDRPAYSMAIDTRFGRTTLYVGTEVGVFTSIDDGQTWTRFGNGLPNVPVRDIQFNQDFDMLAVATQGSGTFTISTDRIGPRVVALTPGTPLSAGVTSIQVTFSEPVDPRSFTLDQVRSLSGPNGPITPLAVRELDPINHQTFAIDFAPQRFDGTYTLSIGPNIWDLVDVTTTPDFRGNLMDQNGNLVNGEDPFDRFTGTFVINSSDTGRYLSGLYNDLLGRASDTGGFVNFLGAVEQARLNALVPVALARVSSDEARGNLVAGFYSFAGAGARTPLPIGNFLGRVPSQAEIDSWVAALKNGATPEQIIAAFVSSPEYFQKNGSTDTGFLDQLFLDLFGRPAGSDRQFWLDFLNGKQYGVRVNIADGFTLSQEFRTVLADGIYTNYLGRSASPSDIQYVSSQLAAGVRTEEILANVFGSPEYFVKHGSSNETWIDSVYQDILERPSDPNGRAGFLSQLQNGVSRANVARQLLFSDEYRNLIVRRTFTKYLGRTPGAAETASFNAALRSGLTQEHFISLVVASSEYYGLKSGTGTQPMQDTNWVSSLYAEVLGRPGSPPEVANFVSILAQQETVSRRSVIDQFLASDEYLGRVVTVVYTKYLGRTPSSAEINLWFGLLRLGPPAAGQPNTDERFIAAIVSSSEYLQRQRDASGLYGDATWVAAIYNDILGRPSSPTEFSQALSTAVFGFARQRLDVAAAITSSLEYRQNLVRTFYQTYLRRTPTAAEVTAGVNRLGAGATDEEFIRDLISSTEYFLSPSLGQGSNSIWLTQIYRDVLGRERDAGAQGFLNGLNGGTLTRSQVAAALLNSTEYRNNLIERYYELYLGRMAGTQEIAFWRSRIEAGLTDEMLIDNIVDSLEYFLRSHPYP